MSEKIATLLVINMGYTTREDLENWSGAQIDYKIIPAITDLDIPLDMSSRLERLIIAVREAAEVSSDRSRREQRKMKMCPPTIIGAETLGVSRVQQVQAVLL